MGGAVQSKVKGWVSLGSDNDGFVAESDPGIFISSLLKNYDGNPESIRGLYASNIFSLPNYERFPEDLLVFSELLELANREDVDSDLVFAILHKMGSPEKMMKELFSLATLIPLNPGLLGQIKTERLKKFIREIMDARVFILDGMERIISLVHEACGPERAFPRWNNSMAILSRISFTLPMMECIRTVNERTAHSNSSLFVDFLQSTPLESWLGSSDIEETISKLFIHFGFWLYRHGHDEPALLCLDTLEKCLPQSIVPVDVETKFCSEYLWAISRLQSEDERDEISRTLIKLSLLFPLTSSTGPFFQLICGGNIWQSIDFLTHCIQIALKSAEIELVTSLCSFAMNQFLADNNEISIDNLGIGATKSDLQAHLFISITYFECLLSQCKLYEAFEALKNIPSTFGKQCQCLKTFIDTLLSDPKHRTLFIQLPWGIWFDLLLEELESRMEFRLLYAIHCHRCDYKSAALAIYKLACCEQLELDDVHYSLLLAKQTLLLCEDAWMTIGESILTPQTIQRDIFTCESKLFVMGRDGEIPQGDLDYLLERLLSSGAYKLAFDLVTSHGKDCSPIFMALSRELVFYQSDAAEITPESLLWLHLWYEGTECVTLDPVASIGKVLQNCLLSHKQNYRQVVELILGMKGKLPEWLVEDFMAHDCNQLARILLKHGMEGECIDLAMKSSGLTQFTAKQLLSSIADPMVRDQVEENLRARCIKT